MIAMTSSEADAILDAALGRLIDAKQALDACGDAFDDTVAEAWDRLREAMRDFCSAHHVAEVVAHIIEDMPAETASA